MPFITPLDMRLFNPRAKHPFMLLDELVYECPLTGETYTVNKYFRTDLASIPIRLAAIPIIGPALVIRYFGNGVFLGAHEGALHDRLRRPDKDGNTIVPAHLAHKIFRTALYDRYPDMPDLCENYYAAVVAFNS